MDMPLLGYRVLIRNDEQIRTDWFIPWQLEVTFSNSSLKRQATWCVTKCNITTTTTLQSQNQNWVRRLVTNRQSLQSSMNTAGTSTIRPVCGRWLPHTDSLGAGRFTGGFTEFDYLMENCTCISFNPFLPFKAYIESDDHIFFCHPVFLFSYKSPGFIFTSSQWLLLCVWLLG